MQERRLSAQGFILAANKFKMLADPTRLRILDLLRHSEKLSVNEVAQRLNFSQPTASKQLSKLHEAHIIERYRVDNSVFYKLEDHSIFELCEAVCGRLEQEATDRVGLLYETDKED